MSLLGSAPPRSAGFADVFLERRSGVASFLDQGQNIDNGMQSPLQGMSCEKFSKEYDQDDFDDLVLEHRELGGVPITHHSCFCVLCTNQDDDCDGRCLL